MDSKINFQSLDPAERDWEYDDAGTRIYKPDAGYGTKTPYKDEYEEWKKQFGADWHDPPDYKNQAEQYPDGYSKEWRDREDEQPYYVDLP